MAANEDVSEKRSFYAVIPSAVLADKTISSTAKLIFAELYALADDSGACFPSNSHFAQLLGISERQVRTSFAQLVQHHLITTIVEDHNKRITTIVEGRKKTSGGEEENFLGVGRKLPHSNTLRNNKKKYKEKGTSYPREYLDAIPEEDTLRLTGKYNVSKHQVLIVAEKMQRWLDKSGKSYKNYKAALEDWVEREYPRRDADGYINVRDLPRLRAEQAAQQAKEAAHGFGA